ncbi:MAG: hypothetical protein R3C45_20820 [Phycisphaerales bacterium]
MNDNDTTITDADLLTLIFDETAPSNRRHLEQSICTDSLLAGKVRRMRDGLSLIEPTDDAGDMDVLFNDRLRRAWSSESQTDHATQTTVQSAGSGRPRINRWSVPLAAAAAIALALVVWMPTGRPGGNGTAWAEVTQAMQAVTQFRMTVFGSDPGTMFKDFELFHLEFYFRQPDRWRSQGWGRVCLLRDGEASLYDTETGKPIENHGNALVNMTRDVAEGGTGVLDAILNELFNNAPPPGEPVLSDSVALQAGIDAFDYVGDPNARRARVWVLRESKLPLRIHIYTEGTEDFMLVSFDYSDPKPRTFFDAESLAAEP